MAWAGEWKGKSHLLKDGHVPGPLRIEVNIKLILKIEISQFHICREKEG